eukprot:TRINITY_DN82407_c0_g1_i1.p1 TRINITY_DN82407_c0_g1~~TRINITY_DN82407_c0_g1_i1.p1  ORF type:complete len:245 (-),score=35.98 TRINITY_DN82407_c0_g1_i1:319-1053(-)
MAAAGAPRPEEGTAPAAAPATETHGASPREWEARYKPGSAVTWCMGPSRRRAPVDEEARMAFFMEGIDKQHLENLDCSIFTPWTPPPQLSDSQVPKKLPRSYSDLLGSAAPKSFWEPLDKNVGRRRQRGGEKPLWDLALKAGISGQASRAQEALGGCRETAITLDVDIAGGAPRLNHRNRRVPPPGTYLGAGFNNAVWTPKIGSYATLGKRPPCMATDRYNFADRFAGPRVPPPYDVNQHVGPF